MTNFEVEHLKWALYRLNGNPIDARITNDVLETVIESVLKLAARVQELEDAVPPYEGE